MCSHEEEDPCPTPCVTTFPPTRTCTGRSKHASATSNPTGSSPTSWSKPTDGLRHIGVWDSQEAWQRFHDERVEPAVHAVLTAAGFTEMPPDPPVEELKLVDVWVGT